MPVNPCYDPNAPSQSRVGCISDHAQPCLVCLHHVSSVTSCCSAPVTLLLDALRLCNEVSKGLATSQEQAPDRRHHNEEDVWSVQSISVFPFPCGIPNSRFTRAFILRLTGDRSFDGPFFAFPTPNFSCPRKALCRHHRTRGPHCYYGA